MRSPEIEFSVQATTNAADGATTDFRLYNTPQGPRSTHTASMPKRAVQAPFEYRRTITIDYTKLGASCSPTITDLTGLSRFNQHNRRHQFEEQGK